MKIDDHLLQSAFEKLLRDVGGTTPSSAPNLNELPKFDKWGDPLFRNCPRCAAVFPCFIIGTAGLLIGTGFPRGCYVHDAELWAEVRISECVVNDEPPASVLK